MQQPRLADYKTKEEEIHTLQNQKIFDESLLNC